MKDGINHSNSICLAGCVLTLCVAGIIFTQGGIVYAVCLFVSFGICIVSGSFRSNKELGK